VRPFLFISLPPLSSELLIRSSLTSLISLCSSSSISLSSPIPHLHSPSLNNHRRVPTRREGRALPTRSLLPSTKSANTYILFSSSNQSNIICTSIHCVRYADSSDGRLIRFVSASSFSFNPSPFLELAPGSEASLPLPSTLLTLYFLLLHQPGFSHPCFQRDHPELLNRLHPRIPGRTRDDNDLPKERTRRNALPKERKRKKAPRGLETM